MGSTAATSFSFANYLQNLTATGSPQLSSTLSNPTVQSALQNAPLEDVVALSTAAVQLQDDNVLFNDPAYTPTNPIPTDLSNILDYSGDASSGTTTNTNTPAASLASQLGGYQADLQSQELQTLFGTTSTGPSLSSLFNVIG